MLKYTPNWLFCWLDPGFPAWIRLLLAFGLLLTGGATDAYPWACTTTEPWYWGRPLRPRAWGYHWDRAVRTL